MEEDSNKRTDLTPEESKFLDTSVSYLGLTQFTGPLRDTDIVLTSVLIDVIIAIRRMDPQGESKERIDSAWDKLREVFTHMDILEKRADRVLSARQPWDESGDQDNE